MMLHFNHFKVKDQSNSLFSPFHLAIVPAVQAFNVKDYSFKVLLHVTTLYY